MPARPASGSRRRRPFSLAQARAPHLRDDHICARIARRVVGASHSALFRRVVCRVVKALCCGPERAAESGAQRAPGEERGEQRRQLHATPPAWEPRGNRVGSAAVEGSQRRAAGRAAHAAPCDESGGPSLHDLQRGAARQSPAGRCVPLERLECLSSTPRVPLAYRSRRAVSKHAAASEAETARTRRGYAKGRVPGARSGRCARARRWRRASQPAHRLGCQPPAAVLLRLPIRA